MAPNHSSTSLQNFDSLGVLFAILAMLFFSIQTILIKVSINLEITVVVFILYRATLTLPIIWLPFFNSKKKSITHKEKILACIAGLFGFYLNPLLFITGLKYIDASISAIILSSFPAFVLLIISIHQKKLPTFPEMFLIITIPFGIAFTTGAISKEAIWIANLFGTSLTILATIFFAIYVHINHITVNKTGSINFVRYSRLAAFIAILVHFIITETTEALLINTTLIYIILLIVILNIVMTLLFSEAIKHIGSKRSSIIGSLSPIVTILFAYYFLQEKLDLSQITGGAIVVLSVITIEILNLRNRKRYT